MITYEQALAANEFWHMAMKNADGTPVRARRNGQTKTWKTKPGQFRIPCKHGLHQCFYIQNYPAENSGNNVYGPETWCIPALWEAEHVLFEGVAS